MAKDPWHKNRLQKIKNSPAAQVWKDTKSIGSVIDAGLDHVFPGSNKHMDASRSTHFNQGAGEHIPVREDDGARFDNFYSRGVGMGSQGNVSSILNGIAIRGAKAARKPEGY